MSTRLRRILRIFKPYIPLRRLHPLRKLRPLKIRKSPERRKKRRIMTKNVELFQDYVSARDSSSLDLAKKFSVSPTHKTHKIKLKDGDFYYRNDDIEQMLSQFQEPMSRDPTRKTSTDASKSVGVRTCK